MRNAILLPPPALRGTQRWSGDDRVRVRAVRSFQCSDASGRPGALQLDVGMQATVPWRDARYAIVSGFAEEVRDA